MTGRAADDWEARWSARQTALESVLGTAEPIVGHANIPLGAPDWTGGADLLYFKQHIDGVVAVTADLIGMKEHRRNIQGSYELAICHRNDDSAGPGLISWLANYTLEAVLEPGQTMSISGAVPEGSSIAGLLFFDYARMRVRGERCGLLLCIGITEDELARCRAGYRTEVENRLKGSSIYPYTDWHRSSSLR